jgi:hypothetical protein
MDYLLIAIQLITVHMIDGREVEINPHEVVRMQTSDGSNHQIPDAVQCVIWFTDGKYLPVVETCQKVRELIDKEF